MVMTLTKKNVLLSLPCTRRYLLHAAPTDRHVRRLDKILESLKRRGGLVEETRFNEKGEVISQFYYLYEGNPQG